MDGRSPTTSGLGFSKRGVPSFFLFRCSAPGQQKLTPKILTRPCFPGPLSPKRKGESLPFPPFFSGFLLLNFRGVCLVCFFCLKKKIGATISENVANVHSTTFHASPISHPNFQNPSGKAAQNPHQGPHLKLGMVTSYLSKFGKLIVFKVLEQTRNNT